MQCPFCKGTQGRSRNTPWGRWVTECGSCGRIVEERHVHDHPLFLLRAHDKPLCIVTPDHVNSPKPPPNQEQEQANEEEEDPFEPAGFITAFSTWSLEPAPLFARTATAFSGHLAELERALFSSTAPHDSSGPLVSLDLLRAYLQITDVSSILTVDRDIVDHAFQLFRDCSSSACLRNRNIEALATAALVQAIREAQEPRTLQEISAAANLPQKEIGKYIKVLGESLHLSQPINSNSIAVHMPRFCSLLQLNKSAQELAAHIGEVVINKCFCTRRNPISISAAAIYLACQLEDKRKTQAEICKVTGLTEVTLRKVYKELLENWDDLLPPNYTPAVPPEKAFPMTAISSGRFLVRGDPHEQERDRPKPRGKEPESCRLFPSNSRSFHL
ncbi:plant-specific TFIIB-related protein [Wolffia australiana]